MDRAFSIQPALSQVAEHTQTHTLPPSLSTASLEAGSFANSQILPSLANQPSLDPLHLSLSLSGL